MMIQSAALDTLNQLSELISQFCDHEYALGLSILSGSSIGQHSRHIIEFYECFFEGISCGTVDYDERKRNISLETDTVFAIERIKKYQEQIVDLPEDRLVLLQITFQSSDKMQINSSLYRELVYMVEHTIHHLALIKIGVRTHFDHIRLPSNLGMAYSTIKYQSGGHQPH
jgi:uncharacterized damage-inducible protein DinB